MLRTCKGCGVEQDIEKFPTAGTINGVAYRRHKCQRCYQGIKDKYRFKIREQFREWKQTLSCNRCGTEDHRVLCFHHIDPTDKEFNLADVVNRGTSLKTIKKEAKKCEVLCANCHAIEHYAEE